MSGTKKHIAIVTPTYFPLRGGSEQTIFEWISRLKNKYMISIITPLVNGVKRREYPDKNVTIYRFNFINIPGIVHFTRAYKYFKTLAQCNSEKPIDLIHLCHVMEPGLGTIIFKYIENIPVVTSLLGWDTYDPIEPVRKIYWPYIAYVMNNADKVVTITRHMAVSAKQQGCKKEIKIIPHGSSLHESSSKVQIREKYNIQSESKIVLSIQRLHPRKGLIYLIRAIPEVLKKFPSTVFLIGGTGHLESELKFETQNCGIATNVIFTGFIPDEHLSSYYEQADLFALPSLFEGFGLVYIDALTKGLPIVTTQNGGAQDIITDEVGLLVPIRNSKAFADAINKALNTKWNKKRIVNRSLRYKWENIVRNYISIYNEILSQK